MSAPLNGVAPAVRHTARSARPACPGRSASGTTTSSAAASASASAASAVFRRYGGASMRPRGGSGRGLAVLGETVVDEGDCRVDDRVAQALLGRDRLHEAVDPL